MIQLGPGVVATFTEEEQRIIDAKRTAEEPRAEKAALAPVRRAAVKLLAALEKKIGSLAQQENEKRNEMETLGLCLPFGACQRLAELFNRLEIIKTGGAAAFKVVIWEIDNLTWYQIYQNEHRSFEGHLALARGNLGAMDKLMKDIEDELKVLRGVAGRG